MPSQGLGHAEAAWRLAAPYRPYRMSEHLWARVAAVLATVDPIPPPHARALLDVIVYRAVTVTAWEALPPTCPSVPEVRAAGERWQALGLFLALAQELHVRLDV